MAKAKSHLQGHLVVDRSSPEPLVAQVVSQLHEAIASGRVEEGMRLPPSRMLATRLGVSRNTILAAYDDLASRGTVYGRHGAGMFVAALRSSVDVKALLAEAPFPSSRPTSVRDLDGNRLEVMTRSGSPSSLDGATSMTTPATMKARR